MWPVGYATRSLDSGDMFSLQWKHMLILMFGNFRFELDMLLESVSSTSKRAEELLNSMNENKLSMETQIHIEDHFTGLYL
jgi:hypothetical protein